LRIVIPTTGSRGDVQPYVALGVGLRDAGHRVCIATHTDFEPMLLGHGLEFAPIVGPARQFHESRAGRRMLISGRNALEFMRHFSRLRADLMGELMEGCWRACRGAELVVVTTTAFLPGHAAAEKLRVPAVAANYVPVTPTRFLASCLLPQAPSWLPGRAVYNLLSHLLVGETFWQLARQAVNRARVDVLGLPPLPFLGPPMDLFHRTPVLCGYSPAVVPRPPDWGTNMHMTGYWFLERNNGWLPPQPLLDFLQAGPPPVCVGFGSMLHPDAPRLTEVVTRALARAGQRGILLTGWGGMAPARATDRLYVTESVPHDWLFPRAAAVVHHGGAGTTAAALRAGVPSVVVPFMADQPFWGWRVHALGAGPRPIALRQLTAGRLAGAVRQAVTDPGVREGAARLGKQIQCEDGVARAVEVIEDLRPTEDECVVRGRRFRRAAGPKRAAAGSRLVLTKSSR
jgi:UDP:flavonoid glycosyltransferase YjiC (YdhE family)